MSPLNIEALYDLHYYVYFNGRLGPLHMHTRVPFSFGRCVFSGDDIGDT